MEIQHDVEAMRSTLIGVADKVWELAELSLTEEKSGSSRINVKLGDLCEGSSSKI